MILSITNKFGIALLACGALLVAGFNWLHPIAIVVGITFLLFGLYFSFKGPKHQSSFVDSSHTNDGPLSGDD